MYSPLQKMRYIITIFITVFVIMIFGCSDNSVSPASGPSSNFAGETKFLEYVDPGNTTQPVIGKTQGVNQIAVFRDSSDNAQLTGLRNVVVTSNSQGNSYGTFSMETNGVHWEGTWTGTTTSLGTTIKATGYDLNERGKSCVWYYYLSSSQDGKAGKFSARINYERD